MELPGYRHAPVARRLRLPVLVVDRLRPDPDKVAFNIDIAFHEPERLGPAEAGVDERCRHRPDLGSRG